MFTILLFLLLNSCGDAVSVSSAPATEPQPVSSGTPDWLNPAGTTISTRFQPPAGFVRDTYALHEFGSFLQHQPVKPHGTAVRLYDGTLKSNQAAHAAVLEVDVEPRDLQQCADAVMRLRAEYLFAAKRYADIHFNFVNGFNARYDLWRKGQRIRVSGNNVSWTAGNGATPDYRSFRKYLTMVFSYAGTASLVRELQPKEKAEIEVGDVLIKGGSPGHAVIVLDKATQQETGETLVLLGQSYMPAQDIHVLVNPNHQDGNPWYSVTHDFGPRIHTAEYTFADGALRGW